MRVLLLHAEDQPDGRPWSREHWDLVVDLGLAGANVYADWITRMRCKVFGLHQLVRPIESYRWVNEFFQLGRSQLLDQVGLDWWEILAILSYSDILALYLFQRLQREQGIESAELWASRPDRSTRIAEQALGVTARYFSNPGQSALRRIVRPLQSARNLKLSQITEIAFDKWDSDYALRGRWLKHDRPRMQEPCLLLPSAYSNVTRSVLAYAAQLPSRKFLLVATRPNANPSEHTSNVTVESLAAYMQPPQKTHQEAVSLKRAWHNFMTKMQQASHEFRCLALAGVWDHFPRHLEHGLRLREAWSSVLQSEPVTGVLCGDDLNHHTRLPLILAQKQGLTAVYCSHGALDGGFLFKKPYANSYLVKGEMERDYLQRAAGLEAEIVVGAPGQRRCMSSPTRSRDAIVFFSQPYEVSGGRADLIYREIIPRLDSVARTTGRQLIVKLHPFESRRARRALVTAVIPASRRGMVDVVDGQHLEHVISRAWCGLTVDSSVAVECALNEIPFFLCGWLDFNGMGYVNQFAQFDVARVLRGPEEIERIPEMIAEFRWNSDKLQRLWHGGNSNQLEQLLFGRQPSPFSSAQDLVPSTLVKAGSTIATGKESDS